MNNGFKCNGTVLLLVVVMCAAASVPLYKYGIIWFSSMVGEDVVHEVQCMCFFVLTGLSTVQILSAHVNV